MLSSNPAVFYTTWLSSAIRVVLVRVFFLIERRNVEKPYAGSSYVFIAQLFYDLKLYFTDFTAGQIERTDEKEPTLGKRWRFSVCKSSR